MSPERLSATVTAGAVALMMLLMAFNLGRLEMASRARKCPASDHQWASIPIKGGFDD